jgi:hypothetical protein
MGEEFIPDAALFYVEPQLLEVLSVVFCHLIPPFTALLLSCTACLYAIDVMMLDGWLRLIP